MTSVSMVLQEWPPAATTTVRSPAILTSAGGPQRVIADVADPAPRYDGPGSPLAPAFGELFAAGSSASGALTVAARLHDPDTAARVTYRDAVDCKLVPCA